MKFDVVSLHAHIDASFESLSRDVVLGESGDAHQSLQTIFANLREELHPLFDTGMTRGAQSDIVLLPVFDDTPEPLTGHTEWWYSRYVTDDECGQVDMGRLLKDGVLQLEDKITTAPPMIAIVIPALAQHQDGTTFWLNGLLRAS